VELSLQHRRRKRQAGHAPGESIEDIKNQIAQGMAQIQSVFSAATAPIVAFANTVVDVFNTIAALVEPVLARLWAGILLGVQNIAPQWDNLVETFNKIMPVFGVIAEVVGAVVLALAGAIAGALPGAMLALGGAVQAVLGLINVAADLIMGFVNVIVKLFHGDLQGAGLAVIQMFTDLGSEIPQILGGLLQVVWGIIGTLVMGVVRFFTTLYDTIVGHSIIPDLVAGIIASISTLPSAVLGYITTLVTTAIDTFTTFSDDMKTLIGEVVTWIADTWNTLPKTLAGTGQAIVQAVWDGIKEKWHELVEWFNDKLQELRDKLPFSEPKDKSSPLYGLADSGAAMVEMIQSGIDGFGDGLPSVFASSLAPVGATLPALSTMPSLPAGSAANNVYTIGPIDARGSNWTEEQFKQMIRSVLSESGDAALSRAKMRG
jgi:hypothetical protein